MFDMSLTYILVALVAVLLNNALVERLSLHTRITAGTPPLPTRLPALTPGRHMPSIPCVRLTLLVCKMGAPPRNVMGFNYENSVRPMCV